MEKEEVKKEMTKTQEEQKAYDEQERLIEENWQKAPEKAPSQVIKWVYRSKINESLYCMNEEGVIMSHYSGKFTSETKEVEGVSERKITGIAAQILQDAPPEAEFYTSFSGELSFAPQTREQWGK